MMSLAWIDQALGPIPLSIVDLLVWTLAGLFIIERYLSENLRQVRIPPLPVLLFVAWYAFAARFWPWSSSVGDWVGHEGVELFQVVEYLIVGFILFDNLMEDDVRLRRSIVVLGTVLLAVTMVAVYQVTAGEDAFDVGGGFANRNLLGAYFALLAPVGIALALRSRDPLVQVLASLPALAGLFLITSGGAYAALLLGIGVAAAMIGRRRLGIVVVSAAVMAWVALTVVRPAAGDELVRSVEPYVQRRGADVSVDPWFVAHRYRRWQANLYMIQTYPVDGVGPGRYQDKVEGYFPHYLQADKTGAQEGEVGNFNVTQDEPDTHGWFWVTTVEAGLPALVLLMWALFYFLGQGIRPPSDPISLENMEQVHDLRAGLCGAVTALLILGIWTSPMVRGLGLLTVFLLAALNALGRRVSDPVARAEVEAAPLSPGSSSGFLSMPIFGGLSRLTPVPQAPSDDKPKPADDPTEEEAGQ
jgi:hypothetical protein